MKKILFEAGKRYNITTSTVLVERLTTKPNQEGDMDDILMNGQELIVSIQGEGGHVHNFIDQRHLHEGVTINNLGPLGEMENITPNFVLQDLVEHFDIPKVPDVAETQPEAYASIVKILTAMSELTKARCGKFLKRFQIEDLARGSLHDGLVLAWETGLGKSLAMFLYPLLKINGTRVSPSFTPEKPVLLVAPENLHDNIEAEAREFFGCKITRLDCQATYRKLRPLKPGWYLTSYTQLSLNKVETIPNPLTTAPTSEEVAKLMLFYRLEVEDVRKAPAPPETGFIERARAMCLTVWSKWSNHVGDFQKGVKCVYSASLGDECGHEFAAVVIDEGTRIKGQDTIIGKGVRQLDPEFRLVLTATPVKNRLRDVFWLLWWAAGGKSEAHPRFPYTDADNQQEQFAAEFNVCERNLTEENRKAKGKKVKKKKKKARGKPGVEVCNIHRLWKLIAPLILRRRMADIGEEVVKMIRHDVYVPMGLEQQAVVRYHLLAPYLDKNEKPSVVAKLQALRSCAAAPTSDLLLPNGDGDGIYRSEKDYTPKLAAALSILEQCMLRREQTVVFSSLHEPLDTMARRLTSAGIPCSVLDGRTSPAERGRQGSHFKRGIVGGGNPVQLCGMGSMAEGNNWPNATNVILISHDWAFDLIFQCIKRIHRLTSPKDVNFYPIICRGTVDVRLASLYDEKREAAELVLDGQLIGENFAEINMAELLKVAVEEFKTAKFYPEDKLEADWPELRQKLSRAWFYSRTGIKGDGNVTLAATPVETAAIAERTFTNRL